MNTRPSKLWLAMATLALTVGMGTGNLLFGPPSIEPIQAHKMALDSQAFSLNFGENTKTGVRRSNHKVSFLTAKDADPLALRNLPKKYGSKRVCFWEQDSVLEEVYSAEVKEVKLSRNIGAGDLFRVEVHLENTGNMVWYGESSGCVNKPVVNLGTQKAQDRPSSLFYEGDPLISNDESTGWLGNNRLQMVNDAVRPGETAIFAFNSIAPDVNTIYREYFRPVVEHKQWFSAEYEFSVDIPVGSVTEDDEHKVHFIKDLSTDTASLAGDGSIEVDLSEQIMLLRYGDTIVYTLPVSTGAYDTPTPTGKFKILNRQTLRVGSAWPHYHMPYWQGFTSRGHGLHALPYLANDGGAFWYEALNHIGRPVSHGCIRLLPDDAVTVYEFGEIGMPMEIHS